jgi:soluble lytic murein transglycosylase
MMIRSYWAKTILALSCSAALGIPLGFAADATRASQTGKSPAGATTLVALARAYREAPAPARRAALEAYANAHAKETEGYLARLALGIAAYEQKDYAAAIEDLRGLPAKLSAISDYAAYYLAAASVESDDLARVAQDLAPVFRNLLPSPYSGRAWLLEARALKANQPAEAVRVLREHYGELPQPEGDVILADCYQASGDLLHAADFYQRVYYRYLTGDAAARAAAALITLKDTMGPAYPAPLPQQELERADRLLEAREYRQARSEYETLVGQLTGLARDQARVRLGAADLLGGNTATAYPYLRGLDLPESEADAERQYYLEECARRLTDEDEMMAAVNRLAKLYPQSRWRLKALLSASNRFLVTNRPGDYLPLYRAIYEGFPSDPAAANAHWKLAFQAYLDDSSGAAELLREHLRWYPSHSAAGAALYFLARSAEAQNDPGSAAALYKRLAQTFPNTYYAMLTRHRLERPELQSGVPSAKTTEFLASLIFSQATPVPTAATSTTVARIERSRALRSAGLQDLANAELRFAARTDGQPALLAMEMASAADAPAQGLRMMKSLSSDYLNLPLASAPEKYWQLLFPFPYRQDLVANARARDLDPYLVAGLIRQESEFDPQALSRANAYGLTQVRPGTGRQFARRAGVVNFTNRSLFQPTINLKIGTTVLRSMLDQNSGSLEQTLAAYNAGPNRLAEWLTWRTYREPAEFVEAIPFTETREYVQAVLRNADIYRRLYR